jgi:predicted Zn-dependent protease
MAAVSERPSLPWSFHIVDDEMVNAFAVPGGRIYVTRGLLAHLTSEADLAGVLGHEIGHVTARHSVSALSRELAIGLGAAVGLALLDVGEAGEEVASLGLGLMFLKFSRTQEQQADQLGVRYVQRAGLDPHGVVNALRRLQEVSQAYGGGGSPVWLATHPDPDKRWQRLAEDAGLGPARLPTTEEINAFAARLDGLVYGPDPRNGTLTNNTFVQLLDGFQITFPKGWSVEREGQTLAAQSASEDAMVMLVPQQATAVHAAAGAFGQEEGIVVDKWWDEPRGGLPARHLNFKLDGGDGQPLWGTVSFVQAPGRVVAVFGLAEYDAWSTHGHAIRTALGSIGGTADPGKASPRPARLGVVTLTQAMTIRQVAQQFARATAPETLALLNQVGVDQNLPRGRAVKIVRAGR